VKSSASLRSFEALQGCSGFLGFTLAAGTLPSRMGGRRKWLWAAVAAAFVLAVISASAEGGFRRYLRLSRDVEALKDKNRRLGDENARMLREVEALQKDPRALERAAREELGFVKPGEVVFSLEGR
jgi:cell division protein FtsB